MADHQKEKKMASRRRRVSAISALIDLFKKEGKVLDLSEYKKLNYPPIRLYIFKKIFIGGYSAAVKEAIKQDPSLLQLTGPKVVIEEVTKPAPTLNSLRSVHTKIEDKPAEVQAETQDEDDE